MQGNKSYKQKDYSAAFQSYDLMSKKGRAALYNMGNCCFQQGDYALAVVYWSRAEHGATPKERMVIARNKELALGKIGQQDNQSLWCKVGNVFDDILPYASLLILQIFFLLCWYLFVFSVVKQQIKAKKIILSSLSLLIVFSGCLLKIHHTKQTTQSGIIVKEKSCLFVGPDKGLHVISPLSYANAVTVKEVRDEWYKIQYADMIGWVEADVVQII